MQVVRVQVQVQVRVRVGVQEVFCGIRPLQIAVVDYIPSPAVSLGGVSHDVDVDGMQERYKEVVILSFSA